jgi:Tol biopolymer transport system component
MYKALLTSLTLCGAAFAQCVCAPTMFMPSLISGQHEEFRISFTPDGQTLFFARSQKGAWFPQSRKATIYTSSLEGGYWSAPVVASFSGKYSDIDPFVSPDGQRIYFSSIRPVNGQERTDADLWVVEKRGNAWSEPIHLGQEVNSPKDDLYPSVDQQGTLYFGSERDFAGGAWDIYSAKSNNGKYGEAQKLPAPVNTAGWDFNPAISADGSTLIFTGLNLPSGAGFGDLYISKQQDGKWSAPRNMGAPINTASDEFHPSLSPDGKTLYFIRRIPKEGDLYSVTLPTW